MKYQLLRLLSAVAGTGAVLGMIAVAVIAGEGTSTTIRTAPITAVAPATATISPGDVTTTTSGMSFRPSVIATVPPPPLD